MAVLSNTDRAVLRLLRPLPPRVFTYLIHLWLFREPPSFRRPLTFTERIHVKKLFNRDPLLTVTADKYAVREYVARRVGAEFLTELFAVVDDPADLDFDKLPASFVMKATHGNEANIIVRDKQTLDWAAAVATMQGWLQTNWYWFNKEWSYRHIPPRIVVEELLDENGNSPTDYKFFVFSGKVRLVQVDVERFTRHQRNLFDENWRSLAVASRFPRPDTIPCMPLRFTEMKAIAERLAQELEFARVDLYQCGDRIVFGEITHYPDGGSVVYQPREFDRALGDVWGYGRPLPDHFFESI